MSKPVSPMAIGGFTLGALALLVIGLLMFGGSQIFDKDKVRYVIFFDSSLNGLEIGAPVKMQGVKIGTVKDIRLELDPKTTKVYKPVVVEIDRKSFVGMRDKPEALSNDPKKLRANVVKMVAEGFRARLEMQSLLTGLLYVDFGIYPDKPALFTHMNFEDLIELPCIPTTTDELRNTAEQMAEKLRKLPIDQIAQNFSETLLEIRNLLASKEVRQSNVALSATLTELQKTVGTLNRNLEPILKETRTTMVGTTALVQDSRALVNDVHQEVKPVLAGAGHTLAGADKALANADRAMLAATVALDTATAALNKAQSTLATVDGAVGADSTLNETLTAMRDAARSLKNLTDYLERHPEAVISGKDH
ncbi:MAG: MlaD family protein [Candidatus Methylumidiphilus sp.]